MEDSSLSGIDALVNNAFGQLMLELVIVLLLMFILVMSALYDYRERRIPNVISLSGWVIGPVVYLSMSGLPGLYVSLLGMLVALVLTFPLWLLGSIGAGDVKLIASVGALVGSSKILLVLLSVAVAGLIYALSNILYNFIEKKVRQGERDIHKVPVAMFVTGTESKKSEGAKEKIPYAVPIAFGTFVALLLTFQ